MPETESSLEELMMELVLWQGTKEAMMDIRKQVVKNVLDKIEISLYKQAILNQVKEIQGISRKGLENGYPIRPLDMDKASGALGNGKVNAVWTNIFTKGGW